MSYLIKYNRHGRPNTICVSFYSNKNYVEKCGPESFKFSPRLQMPWKGPFKGTGDQYNQIYKSANCRGKKLGAFHHIVTLPKQVSMYP